MTDHKARWELLLSEFAKKPRLQEWQSPSLPVSFSVVDSAFNRYALQPELLDAWDLTIHDSKPNEYQKQYSVYQPSFETDNEGAIVRVLPKQLLGLITISKIDTNQTGLAIKATGYNDDLFKTVVSTFLTNWMAEWEIDKGKSWLGEVGNGGETAVSNQPVVIHLRGIKGNIPDFVAWIGDETSGGSQRFPYGDNCEVFVQSLPAPWPIDRAAPLLLLQCYLITSEGDIVSMGRNASIRFTLKRAGTGLIDVKAECRLLAVKPYFDELLNRISQSWQVDTGEIIDESIAKNTAVLSKPMQETKYDQGKANIVWPGDPNYLPMLMALQNGRPRNGELIKRLELLTVANCSPASVGEIAQQYGFAVYGEEWADLPDRINPNETKVEIIFWPELRITPMPYKSAKNGKILYPARGDHGVIEAVDVGKGRTLLTVLAPDILWAELRPKWQVFVDKLYELHLLPDNSNEKKDKEISGKSYDWVKHKEKVGGSKNTSIVSSNRARDKVEQNNTTHQRRGMRKKRKERALIFKKIKDENPHLSYQGVATHANANYSEKLNKLVEAHDVRNDFKAMEWKWVRADRLR